MKESNNNILKQQLSELKLSSLTDDNVIINYPYLVDFLNRIDNHFPEIEIVLGKEQLYKLVLSKYIQVYQNYLINKTALNASQVDLSEIFSDELNQELTISYSDEIEKILEIDFPDLYSEFNLLEKIPKRNIIAAIAGQVYIEINGNKIYNAIYLPPYVNGYNDEEYNLIREILSSIINNFLVEDLDFNK